MMIVHHYSEAKSLGLTDLYWTSYLVFSIVVGYFTSNYKKAKIMLCSLAALGFVTYILMAVPIMFNYSQILAVVITGGASASGVVIAFTLIQQYVTHKYYGRAIAMNNTFIILGGYVGQVMFGMVLRHINLNSFVQDFISNQGGNPHYYSAILIYLCFTFFALVFALLIVMKNKRLN